MASWAKQRSNLPSHQRAAHPPRMRLTARDIQIILAVYQYRFLNAHQVEALLFTTGSDKLRSGRVPCQRRLQRLYHNGLLDRLILPLVMGEGRAAFVYGLDEGGATIVTTHLGVDRPAVNWQPSNNQIKPLFLDHTLAINDVRVMVDTLVRDGHLKVIEWLDEGVLKSATMKDKTPYRRHGARITRIYPDGYFTLHPPGAEQPAHFFLEVDQGTMSNLRWQEKIEAYIHFRRSGLAQKYYGTKHFRVLTVTTSDRRLQNLKQATVTVGGDRYFWFTTQPQLDLWQPTTLLQPVWQVATQDGLKALW